MLVTTLSLFHTTYTLGGSFHMRTFLYQRPSLLKFYFVASYVVLVEEVVRATLF